jgi:hypothetical protein
VVYSLTLSLLKMNVGLQKIIREWNQSYSMAPLRTTILFGQDTNLEESYSSIEM